MQCIACLQARELAREVYGRREGFWAEHGEDGGHDEGDTDSEGSSEGGGRSQGHAYNHGAILDLADPDIS